VTTGVGDDESPLLAAVHLTLDRTLPGRLGLGGHAVLLLPSLNGDRAVANLLLSLVYRGILDGLLELRAAVGPALNLGDGDGLGLGYGGSIGIPVPLSSSLSAGLELRYDGVRLDGQDLGSVTAGFRVTW
jgi:hypothetical protein